MKKWYKVWLSDYCWAYCVQLSVTRTLLYWRDSDGDRWQAPMPRALIKALARRWEEVTDENELMKLRKIHDPR